MTDNEKLIEEAARAILTWPLVDRLSDIQNARRQARAALAVFEKAHTPTDDEREALARAWDAGHRKGIRWKRGDAPENPYRSAVPEPSAEEDDPITDENLWDFANDLLDAWNIEDTNAPSMSEDFRDRFVARFHPAYRPEPQGEPSDAQVNAAQDAYYATWGPHDVKMRAALRAAGGVR